MRKKLIESNIKKLNTPELIQSVAKQVDSLIGAIKHPNETVFKKNKPTSNANSRMYKPEFNECYFQDPKTNMILKKEEVFISKEEYILSDFTKYNGVEFITSAYIGILKRRPEAGGLALHLKILDKCLYSNSKILILSGLRFSKEGKLNKVKISGLKRQYLASLIFRLPVFGYFFKSIITLLSLPKVIERNYYLEKKIAEVLNTCETNDLKLQYTLGTKALHEDLVNNIKHVVSETKSNLEKLNNKATKHSERQSLILDKKLRKKANIKDFNDFKATTKNSLNSKATISELNSETQLINTTINAKVDKKEIELLKEDIKSNHDDLDELATKVYLRLNSKIEQTDLYTLKNDINFILDLKATKENLLQFKFDLLENMKNETLNLKMEINAILDTKTTLDNLIDLKKNILLKDNNYVSNNQFNIFKEQINESLNKNIPDNNIYESIRSITDTLKSKAERDELLNLNHIVHEELAKKLYRDELQQLRRVIVTNIDEKVRRIEFLKFKKEIEEKLHNVIDLDKGV